ncbi:MAG TPA: tetratricopeptide repeat protein [Burkholderiaceae bacterium]|nr:tetratricopeptide repeat protein [Burkholderiaceae bacterium]
MSRMQAWPGVLLAAAVFLLAPIAGAVESDPLPVPLGTAREHAVTAYNDGVRLMLARQYAAAQQKFEEALRQDNALAEAHNNLAFSLRMQGAHNFERALQHYNRALALKPGLAQAYMYRGVLFTQMGDLSRARADHAQLLVLDKGLAAKLEKIITGGGAAGGNDGVAPQYE